MLVTLCNKWLIVASLMPIAIILFLIKSFGISTWYGKYRTAYKSYFHYYIPYWNFFKIWAEVICWLEKEDIAHTNCAQYY